MARKWRGIQDGTSSGHLCVCPEQQSLGDRPKPQVLAPNLLFPCVQLHLQGLQHPAPPYGAFLPCAPVLRRGCKHPGLQSSPGKHGDQQQHQAAAAGNGGQAWGRVAGARAQTRLLPHTLAGLLAMHSFPHERAQPSSRLCSSLVRHFRAWVPGGSSRKGPPPVTWAWGAVAAGRAPGGSKCSCRRLWGTGCPSVFLPARLQWHKLCTVVRVSHWTF